MLANPPTRTEQPDIDPLVLYSQSLHDYTLRLWTESRRVAEEKARVKAAQAAVARKQEEKQRQRKAGAQSAQTSGD
ncbi:hypothetical protein AcW1_001278 [Taiwanofungus camphoratus]|nr:hypothetical protein AcW2_000197 [Antrodia cinnamomea]KAI0937250.1 hypothetical protein AcV5_005200 [Antrodia cinnamomea]KAI0962460.1 hypothetical protein AcV7_001300 [Antrodia cinnamomea]KAI0964463.1 hypothetical protein AcW1_001278 [Antrodia cinnamomea]